MKGILNTFPNVESSDTDHRALSCVKLVPFAATDHQVLSSVELGPFDSATEMIPLRLKILKRPRLGSEPDLAHPRAPFESSELRAMSLRTFDAGVGIAKEMQGEWPLCPVRQEAEARLGRQ